MKKIMQQSIVLSSYSASCILASLAFLLSILFSEDFYFSKIETIIETIMLIISLSLAIFIISRDTKKDREKEETEKLIEEIGK